MTGLCEMFCVSFARALCTEVYDMQISEAAGGVPAPGAEPCRFPKLEECAHFHYERVQLPEITVALQTNMAQSLHSQHTNDEDEGEWYMIQVTSRDECWLVQRNFENFKMLDAQLHECIYDRKISQLHDLSSQAPDDEDIETILVEYLERFSQIADNSINCGPILNWLQMDNKGHRLLVPSEESRSINTPAVAAAYSVRRYVSQARDELNLEVGDMISVIDMASPGESMWWRGKRGFQVGFFPQHCVHIIGDKIPRNMPLPPPVVGSLALTPIKPVLRKHGKLITFFRSFILNRPSRRRLKQSGILKERVFGCDLGEHLLNSGHRIPMVLKCCAEFIETHGIVDGIYRLSGVNSNIQRLRNAFDEDRIPDLYTEDILQDIHSVACLLKMYFRELPNPLCTYQLYQTFVNAVQGSNSTVRSSEIDNERLLRMREAVQKLPPPHYRTLKYLMQHLAKVAKHGARTGMTTRNVAIVWAPNLLRSEDLEYGGVAALQGVGVQAVVTEFLICYADLIFCDHLPKHLDLPLQCDPALSPNKSRPKSLAISTPTKLLSLEEARSKILLNKTEECNYIEVGGGPKNLPKKYHTVIELPAGARKRAHTKRSPLGWRSFFSKSRNNSQGNLAKNNRKATTPGITIAEKSVTESDLTDMKRKLRSVKSAESLTSGHSEPVSTEIDVLGPLQHLNKPPGHNRSVSHDSYFDTLQGSQNNSEGSLLDLSEIQLNFDLEDLEMRIFSEDESLVSSPRIQREPGRRVLTRARPDELNSNANSSNPSPKKQARVVLSPDAMSRKRTRLEDQLSDIQFIDCCTPDNIVSTTAVVHTLPEVQNLPAKQQNEMYQPRNKSPRNSESLEKRQSLNLESVKNKPTIPKSLTEMDLGQKCLAPNSILPSPVPQSPSYKQLGDSSANTTPGISPDLSSPTEITYQHLDKAENRTSVYDNVVVTPVTPVDKSPTSPTYENILTTISITYKSPKNSPAKTPVPKKESPYENINIVNPERAVVPTSTASLPIQQASQPELHMSSSEGNDQFLKADKEQRPRSLSALEDMDTSTSKEKDMRPNLSSSAVCDTNEQLSFASLTDQKTFSSNQSSGSNIQYTQSLSSAPPYHYIENAEQLSPTDLSLSEVVQSSTENIDSSNTSLSFPVTSRGSPSPNVSPTQMYDSTTQDILTPISRSETQNISEGSLLDETENVTTSFGVTQFTTDSERIEESCSLPKQTFLENQNGDKAAELSSDSLQRPASMNLIDFSPVESIQQASPTRSSSNDKRKSSETESPDDNVVYQQVKYFRRSIHEVNALLDIEASEKADEKRSETNEDCEKALSVEKPPSPELTYDSLESDLVHVYENIEGEDMRNENIYEHIEIDSTNIENHIGDALMNEKSIELYEKIETLTQNVDTIERCDETESSNQNQDGDYEDVQCILSNDVKETTLDKLSVRDLKCKFEENDKNVVTTRRPSTDNGSIKGTNETVLALDKSDKKMEVELRVKTGSESLPKVKKVYEKDGLPPCLRARNLKHQLKTRSLDEEEFQKEFSGSMQRRKSLDDGLGHKTNSLPKTLNQPKVLPATDIEKLNTLHLSHSTENISSSMDEDPKKRERIEKYKEERRKFLHDKYRSESFKEDKDVLLSKLKIYKPKDDKSESSDFNSFERPTRTRRRSSRSDDSAGEITTDSLEDECVRTKGGHVDQLTTANAVEKHNSDRTTPCVVKAEMKPLVTESLRTRAAMFEVQANQRVPSSNDTVVLRNIRSSDGHCRQQAADSNAKRVQECKYIFGKLDNGDEDKFSEEFIRNKRRDEDFLRGDRRRHTYESRERESEMDRLRRISLETRSPRKEKESPSYCIKDMKAIFESKSKQ